MFGADHDAPRLLHLAGLVCGLHPSRVCAISIGSPESEATRLIALGITCLALAGVHCVSQAAR
ncbi:hypothetical protein [Microbispora sp. CA-102843]|uniref:hypothetical protein n=1 Tax=Microbispora sp. CA-102843 TaxID=3239952 RepID=UPI003D89C4A6